jgi:hypothetical protein
LLVVAFNPPISGGIARRQPVSALQLSTERNLSQSDGGAELLFFVALSAKNCILQANVLPIYQ